VAVDAELEQAIAALLAAEDPAAAATVALNGLGPQILGFLASTLRDDDARFEVFSQFSEELWKSIASFRGKSSFKTWAYKLAIRAASRYRRDPYRRRRETLASAASQVVQQIRDRTPSYQRTDVKDRFARLREQLEADDQLLLFLRVDQNLSWNDVAEVMSEGREVVDVAALRKRFERTKARLKLLAERDGLLGEQE
jgi:RNA polymerase sigma-70 factor (ECF subfamily)